MEQKMVEVINKMRQLTNKQKLQRNKIVNQTLENASKKGVMIGVDIFKAILGFLKDMIRMVVGK